VIKVYIAGPYGKRAGATDQEQQVNMTKAALVGVRLFRRGFNPFVPHLYRMVDIHMPGEHHEDQWLEICKEWVKACDCVLRIPGPSAGADEEVKLAANERIPIFHDIDLLCEYYEADKSRR